MGRQRPSLLLELLESLEYEEVIDLKTDPDMNLLGVLGYDPISFRNAVRQYIDDNFTDEQDIPEQPQQSTGETIEPGRA